MKHNLQQRETNINNFPTSPYKKTLIEYALQLFNKFLKCFLDIYMQI